MKFWSLVIIVLTVGCNPKPSSNSKEIPNDAFLSDQRVSFSSDQFYYRPPKGWVKFDKQSIERLSKKLTNGMNDIISGYQDPETESFVLALATASDPKIDSTEVANGKWTDIQRSSSFQNDLYLNQVVLQGHSRVVFKVNIGQAAQRPPVGALHFYLNRESANSQADLIRACVKSINRY